MRRAGRYILDGLTGTSIALLTATVVVWVWGYFATVVVSRSLKENGGGESLGWSRGAVWLGVGRTDPLYRLSEPATTRWSFASEAPSPLRGDIVDRLRHLGGLDVRRFPGIAWARRPPDGSSSYVTILVVRCWLLVGLFTIVPAAYTWTRRRGRRQPPGRCPACGYDLRATPGQCPECGLAPAASAGHGASPTAS